jgi:Nucleotidyltransferase
MAVSRPAMTLGPAYVAARTALLDALEALDDHRDALVLVGAQAIYLYTGDGDVAIATETNDSDVLVDPQILEPDPTLEKAMTAARFSRNLKSGQPGEWLTEDGIPVDLLVPKSLAGKGGRRGVRIPPHDNNAARRVAGLEAAVIDNAVQTVTGLAAGDTRSFRIKVAGPSALLVAKLFKVGERQKKPDRLLNKDAHDIYRLIRKVDLSVFEAGFKTLLANDLTASVTETALSYLEELFETPESLGSSMAGAAERLVGDPELVAASSHQLAQDLLKVARG